MKLCTTCGKKVGSTNASGLCVFHYQEERIRIRSAMDARIKAALQLRLTSRQVSKKLGVSMSRVHKASADLAPDRPQVRLAEIIRLVSEHTSCSVADMQGKCRKRPLVMARQAVCLLAAEAGHSTPRIGRSLGGRDHSTVIHGRDIAADRALRYPEYAAMLDLVRSGSSPVSDPEPAAPVVSSTDEEQEKRPKFTPLPADVLDRAIRRLRAAAPKPKNNFDAGEDERDDSGHQFHQGVAAGSQALYDAILRARAA